MSETNPPPPAPPQDGQPQLPPLVVNLQYIKDLSFEVPGGPETFATLKSQPQIQIDLDVQARRLPENNTYEVALAVRVEAKAESKPVFITELAYCGIFTLTGIPDASIEPVLLVECPRLLFPFARNIIADITRESGFPPVMLQPIDFLSLWHSRRAQQAPVAGHA